MIILSVITGYLLGVLPFLFFYALNGDIKLSKKIVSDIKEETNMADIMNEWLNGPEVKPTEKPVNIEADKPLGQVREMYNEFITGKVNGGNNE